MSRMGSTCSMQRERNASLGGHLNRRTSSDGGRMGGGEAEASGTKLRHSVVAAIPDVSIASLYPVVDNYINEDHGKRSPKSLAELSTEALCRSLPYLNGELPPGLPQDVVDDVVESLVKHFALNATTLRVLRNCELGVLSLAGCRGVTDQWLEPLSTRSVTSSPEGIPRMHDECGVQSMDLDDDRKSGGVFYGTFDSHKFEDSSCSTSSFVTATSTPCIPELPQLTPVSAGTPMEGLTVLNTKRSHSSVMVSLPTVTTNLTLLDLRGSQRLTDRGLMQLTDLRRLEVAKLDNCHALVGRGLLALSSSHRLHTLSLANCRRLTDEAVINVSHLLSLEALSLGGCRCLTDRSLAAVADLYALRKLDLSQCDLISDSGLEQLENLECLEELSLGWCRQITDQGIDILTAQPERSTTLRILRMARCPISDQGVEYLGRLVALEELDLNGCSSVGSTALGKTLESLTHLANLDVSFCPGILRSGWQGKITSLKSLELCYSSVRDVHIGKLTFLPALEELNLDSCPIGDWAIGHLADNVVVPNLTSLDLADTDLTDIGMAHIAKFNKLIRLSLFYCNISNRGLRHVAQLTALEVLNLDSREISDDGLSHLANLRNLKSLDIFSGRITDAGCGHIAKITSLESLELCGGGVGDAGCTRLAMLEKLTSLNLSQNERISNRGAAALAALTNLKALNLSNTRVNSSALCFFGGLLKLQSLALYGCHGIEDGARLSDLQNGLPNLKCLRLNSSSQEEGMVISHAADESDYSDEDRWEETNANGFERDMEDGDGDEDDDAFLSDYD